MTSAPSPSASDRIRLHITPFNASIYDRVVSSSAKASATGISYHTVQTQPDLGFGYIELPKMEADKLKKKLHGSTLKGSKVRVEEAKPEKKRKAERDETEEERKERKKAKKAKKEQKAKREEGVIPGYELEDGRYVKRGWSEGGDKKSKEGKKMRFKTAVPPNVMPLEDSDDDKKKKKSKDKKAKREAEKDGEKTKKSHKTPKVVEEFAKKKGVMISAEGESKGALEYVEGQGWVNEEGEVVEAEPLSVRRQRAKERAQEELRQAEARKAQEEQAQEELRHAEAMAVDANEDAESPAEASADEDMAGSDDDDASEVASSISDDSDDEGESDADEATHATADKPATPVPEESKREIHPLEALYKRAPQQADGGSATKRSLAPIDTSFSFFNPDDISDSEEPAASGEAAHAPQTPHTKQDLEWRALRSAAPTPDTAGLGKRFKFAMGGAEDEDEDSDEAMGDADDGLQHGNLTTTTNVDADGEGQHGPESDFRKWFYEHRGENNRAWKKKRKEAKKLQRQRENRRLSRRVV